MSRIKLSLVVLSFLVQGASTQAAHAQVAPTPPVPDTPFTSKQKWEAFIQATTPQKVAPHLPRLDAPAVMIFREGLKQLSQQFSAPFVVEGIPLRKSTEDEIKAAKAAPLPVTVPQEAADFAAAYDYEAAKSEGVFVFRKRYTYPDDIPQVTLDECRLCLRDSKQMLSHFVTIPPQSTRVDPMTSLILYREGLQDRLLSSLSPEQWQAIAQPKGLPLTALSQIQQRKVTDYALESAFHGPVLYTLGTARQLDHLKSDKPQLCFRDAAVLFTGSRFTQQLKGIELFGYDFVLLGSRDFRPQSHPEWAISSATGVRGSFAFDKIGSTTFSNFGKDASEPLEEDFSWVKTENSAPTIYLKEAVSRLNPQSGNSRATKVPPFAVADALADKPVLLVGEKEANPQAVFHALATVYGLRVIREKSGTESIVHLRPPMPRTMNELPAALANALPLPLQKLLRGKQIVEEVIFDSGFIMSRASDARFHIEAEKHLRARTEPAVKSAKNQRVPLDEFGPETTRDLVVALLTTDYLSGLRRFQTKQFPAYLSDPTRTALSGSRELLPDGSQKVTLNICEVRADGELSPRFSMSGLLPAPPQNTKAK